MLQIPDVMDFTDKGTQSLKPTIENEEEVKRNFGMALSAGKSPFDAALLATNNNTNISLWVSQHWLNDPIVLAAKELYLKTVHNSKELLDADELAATLLVMSKERDRSGNFYILEGKDRLAALALYAKIRGFDKSAAPSINNTFNKMVVKFVAPDKKEETIIDQLPNEVNINKSPLKLKLVS